MCLANYGGLVWSAQDIEAIFNSKVAPAIAAGKTDPWMDYHLALYVPDLSEYTTPFKADNIPYLPITFNAGQHGLHMRRKKTARCACKKSQ